MPGVSEPRNLHPAAGELADDNDELSWDRARDGKFADYATPDDTVPTVSGDDYLAETGDHSGGD